LFDGPIWTNPCQMRQCGRMTKPVLVLDEGTSSTRAGLYGRDLQRGDFSQEAVALVSPSPDIVEQDADLIWQASLDVARRALGGGIVPSAIGLTNQRETTIIWERATGRPVHHALVWQDRRGAELGAAMQADGREAVLTAKSGLLADPYFSAFKLHWLLDNIDGLRQAALRGELAFGTVDTWLIWNLTGGKVHATDASNASRTGLYNIFEGHWDQDLLSMFDIPESLLPEVRDSVGMFGETTLFGSSVPILGVVGDQQAALMGQGCVAPGQTKITFGTGAFLMAQTAGLPRRSSSRMLTTIAWQVDGQTSWAMEGAILNAGTAVQWLRDGLGLVSSAADSEALAASVPDSAGVYMVPAFTGLGAPHWAPNAQGLITGIGRGTTKAHVVRAALEAAAFQTADLLTALASDGVSLDLLRVDGGMTANNLFLQRLADITGLNVERPTDLEMTALGAARAAAIALGWRTDPGDGAESAIKARFAPQISDNSRKALNEGWQRAIAASIALGQ
jgi:glycerol kinase